MTARSLAAIAAVALAFALVGCTKTSTPAEETQPTPSSAEQPAEEQPQPEGDGSAPDPATLLTPADVEKVSGMSGLKVVPYDPSIGAGGKVNIATADGQLVTMLVVEGMSVWDAWAGDGMTFGKPYTPAVGDESHIGPSTGGGVYYIFAFRKGDTAIAIDSYFATGSSTKTILTVEQLADLARVVESRL